jgi:MYXO-CTERM domain-containing protein
MPKVHFALALCAVASAPLLLASEAAAQIPAGYLGKPFDPAVAGGPKLPAGTRGGPYPIPGRLDFVNYDMGGDGTGYHTGDHLIKGGAGYRIDMPTATLSWTADCIPNVGTAPCTNVWYDTSPTLDGTPYPSATTSDFTIGSVQVGDWFNFTVNVQTAGTYTVSSTWASGSGPLGGEGGDGSMGLIIFSNGTQLATWSTVFPNYLTEADFHHWVAYPNFARVTLAAGPQVIKLQSTTKHLQLDYVQFALATDDGGVPAVDAGGSGASSGTGATSGTGTATSTGTTTGTSSGTSSNGTSSTGTSSTGTSSTGGGSTSGGNGANGTGTTGSSSGTGAGDAGDAAGPASQQSGCGCSTAGAPSRASLALGFGLAALALGRRRRSAR